MSHREDARLTIGELAGATGHSVHTLRYYEQAGLIPDVKRNGAGHRRYRDDHVRWVGLLERLRASGMSIARMREYVRLARRGDAAAADRALLLREHASDIEARIEDLRRCLAIVRAKIDLYEGREDDPSRVWGLVTAALERRSDRGGRGLRGPNAGPGR